MKLNKRIIDKAIKHLDLQIIHARGSGYSYFVSLTTDTQVGESVYVCNYNHLTLQQWLDSAEEAIRFEAENPNY
jgi:hypothetical protein